MLEQLFSAGADHVAALVIRDAVASGVERLDVSVRLEVERVAEEVDSVFRNYTEDDADGCTGWKSGCVA